MFEFAWESLVALAPDRLSGLVVDFLLDHTVSRHELPNSMAWRMIVQMVVPLIGNRLCVPLFPEDCRMAAVSCLIKKLLRFLHLNKLLFLHNYCNMQADELLF